mmetsp:Transcript_21043/g.42133  ORF Transcript_21043/g.42133 Transcript_21043/m.42133 type:complete len:351 (+) Transcript_21043:87-1139(+)
MRWFATKIFVCMVVAAIVVLFKNCSLTWRGGGWGSMYLSSSSTRKEFGFANVVGEAEREKYVKKIVDRICNPGNNTEEYLREHHRDIIDVVPKNLCVGKFVSIAVQRLLDGRDVSIVQIGAHVGFEPNDPVANILIEILEGTAALDADARRRLHWVFVEPSPSNFARLTENISQRGTFCDTHMIETAVIPDNSGRDNLMDMPFYSIRDTVDPETGFDSVSGKTLPFWITQISSFDKKALDFAILTLLEEGLNPHEYILETAVTKRRFSDVMEEAMAGRKERPLLLLIDTEGFDCDIVNGMPLSSMYLPEYLVFEHKICGIPEEHLSAMDYDIMVPYGTENIVLARKNKWL